MRETLKDLKNCWLSPRGRIIVDDHEFDPSRSAWHESLALCILRDIYKVDDYLEAFCIVHKKPCNTATEELEGKGYIRLCGWGITPSWIVPIDKRFTKKQESTITDWCLINNIKYISSIYDCNMTKYRFEG